MSDTRHHGRRWRVAGFLILLAATLTACASAPIPTAYPPPQPITGDRPEWLDDNDWARVLSGEIVVASQKLDEAGLRAYRGAFLLEVAPQTMWEALRQPETFRGASPEMESFTRVEADPDGLRYVYLLHHDVFPQDVDFAIEYRIDDARRMNAFRLHEGYPHNIEEIAGFHQVVPTANPAYTVYIWSMYIVTGWWYMPLWVEHRIQSSKVMRMMIHYRDYYIATLGQQARPAEPAAAPTE